MQEAVSASLYFVPTALSWTPPFILNHARYDMHCQAAKALGNACPSGRRFGSDLAEREARKKPGFDLSGKFP